MLTRRRRILGLLAGAGIALLAVAWVFSTAPFAAPDEGAHYLRAVSISNGVLAGHARPFHGLYWPAQESAYVSHDNRTVSVPASLAPPLSACLNGKPDRAGSCTMTSYVGDYPPLPYLLPALAIKASGHLTSAFWLSRLLSMVLNLIFILLALALIMSVSNGSLPLVGILAAASPMVLFVSSVISPNGLEIASNFAFFAGILWALREPRGIPVWARVSTAVSGVFVVLAWSLGPVIIVMDLVVAATLARRDRLAALVGDHGRAVITTAAVLIVAGVVFLLYGKMSGLLHAGLQLHRIFNALWVGRHQDGIVLHDAVGVFGALSIRLPSGVYLLWWGLVLALCVAAAMRSGRHGRVAMVITLLVVMAFPILFWAFYFRQVTGLQGRYVLPILVLAPLVAGYLLDLNSHAGEVAGRPERLLIAGGVTLIALMQLYAWWINARAYAGTRSAHWALNHPLWSPPLGWLPWLVLAVLGTLAFLAMAAIELEGHRYAYPPTERAPADTTPLATTVRGSRS